jgi:hypothetical protein
MGTMWRNSLHCGGAMLCVALAFSITACVNDNGAHRTCFTVGYKENTIVIRDYEYARYRLFDVGPITDPVTQLTYELITPDAQILEFRLFESTGISTERQGLAYEFWPDTSSHNFNPGPISSEFIELENSVDYWFDINRHAVLFLQRNSLRQTRILAYYVRYSVNGETVEIGRLSEPLRLQILKRANPSPTDPFWNAEWKNVYDLGVRNIDYNAFDLRIYKGDAGTEQNPSVANPDHQGGVPYLEILGLDVSDASGNLGSPDGKIDANYEFLDLQHGLLFFPDRRPFDADSSYAVGVNAGVTLDERVPLIYDSSDDIERRNVTKYYIKLTVRTRASSFSLGRLNIIPGSEVAMLGGRTLTRGTDYNIDYEIGRIGFLTDAVLDPNADLTICFDYCP